MKVVLRGLVIKEKDNGAKNTVFGAVFAGLLALVFIIGVSNYVLAAPSGAPTDLQAADALDGAVKLTWTPPEDDGGEPIFDYIVEYRESGGGDWAVYDDGVSTNNTASVSDLTDGTTYEFRVSAENADDVSDPSNVVSATPVVSRASEPVNLVATYDAASVSLGWDEPLYAGAFEITDYIVEYRESGSDTWQIFSEGVSVDTSATVTGLTNGVSYDFRVAAFNDAGTSDYSSTVSSTPMTIPGAPVIGTATRGNAQATVTFSAPSDNGGSDITGYTVVSSPGGITASDDDSPITVTGLTNGTEYAFMVFATNSEGDGASSAVSNVVTPAAAPGAPTDLSAVPTDGAASLSWSAPADNGGLEVADYIIEYRLTGAGSWSVFSDGTSAATSAVVEGLVNGESYIFRVAAVNGVDTGVWSDTATTTPRTTPDSPSGLSATPGSGQVSLSWSAPVFNGGSAITDYIVQYGVAGSGDWETFDDGNSVTASVAVTGLNNGTDYDFRVAAVNAAGQGAYSSAIEATPYTTPDAPTGVSAVRGDGQAVVSFTAPAFNGGSAITGYKVVSSPGEVEAAGANSPITVTGLTNGTEYTFTVIAVNTAGDSLPSDPSAGVVPGAVASAPTDFVATAGNTEAGLSWVAPESNGGYPITDYMVEYRLSTDSNWTTFSDLESADTSAVVTGLTNGLSYDFRVRAVNDFGPGATSAVETTTPRTTSGAPTGLSATPGDGEVELSWSAPVGDGGSAVTDYVVEYKLTADSEWSEFADGVSAVTTATVDGLTNGSSYDFRVSAVNAAGQGSESGIVASTPRTVPGAPVIGTATRGNEEAVITFSAPTDNGGSEVIDYTVTSSPGGVQAIGSSSPITVIGLDNGTSYTFTVTARNVAGNSVASAASNSVTPATVPGTPTITSTTAGNGQVTVEFTAPTDDGGSAITGYTVTSTPGNFTGTSSDVSPIVVTGLLNGTSYTFTVTATNDVGASADSATSSPVTPYTLPDAPTGVSAVRGDGEATVSFVAPEFDGGSDITEYTVTSTPGGVSASGIGSPIVVTGLGNGTEYTFTVVATNAAGTSPASAPSDGVTPGAVPGAPTNLVATPGDQQVSLSWSAPNNNGGSEIVDYVVEYKLTTDSSWTIYSDLESADTTALVGGLTNGESYDFRVSAVNESVGAGPASSAVSATAATVPGAPTNLTALPDNARVDLSWSVPVSDGGAVVTDYIIEYKLVADADWTVFSDGESTNTTLTVTGLTNGLAYSFRVSAVNSAGIGALSDIVSSTPDLTYPVISDIAVSKSEDDPSVVSISWSTDILANSQVEYSKDDSFSGSSPLANTGGVNEHIVALVDLEACTAYNFRIASESLIDGGRAISSGTFTTAGCPEQPEEEDDDKTDAGSGGGKEESTVNTGVSSGSESESPATGSDEDDSAPDLSVPVDEQGETDAGHSEDAEEDVADEDEGSDWTVWVWVAAGVVGAGAVVSVATSGRRTK